MKCEVCNITTNMISFLVKFYLPVHLTSTNSENMQLYARRHFLFPPLNIEEYNDRVTAVVRCEAQVRFCSGIV